MNWSVCRITAVGVMSTLLFSVLASAQGIVTGSISAVVEDSQGAVVSDAEVQAVDRDTRQVFKTAATASGIVALRSLPPAIYDVTITSTGFKKYQANEVLVVVGKDTALGTVVLKVGSVGETINVESGAPLVESTTN